MLILILFGASLYWMSSEAVCKGFGVNNTFQFGCSCLPNYLTGDNAYDGPFYSFRLVNMDIIHSCWFSLISILFSASQDNDDA